MDGAAEATWNPNNFDIPHNVRQWMHGLDWEAHYVYLAACIEVFRS